MIADFSKPNRKHNVFLISQTSEKARQTKKHGIISQALETTVIIMRPNLIFQNFNKNSLKIFR